MSGTAGRTSGTTRVIVASVIVALVAVGVILISGRDRSVGSLQAPSPASAGSIDFSADFDGVEAPAEGWTTSCPRERVEEIEIVYKGEISSATPWLNGRLQANLDIRRSLTEGDGRIGTLTVRIRQGSSRAEFHGYFVGTETPEGIEGKAVVGGDVVGDFGREAFVTSTLSFVTSTPRGTITGSLGEEWAGDLGGLVLPPMCSSAAPGALDRWIETTP